MSCEMKKEPFSEKDFYTDGLIQLVFCHSERAITCVDAAKKANAKIKQWLSEAPVVFSYGDQNEWRKKKAWQSWVFFEGGEGECLIHQR